MKRFRVIVYLNKNDNLVFLIHGSKTVTVGEIPFNSMITDKFFDELYEQYANTNDNPVTRKYFDKAVYEATKTFCNTVYDKNIRRDYGRHIHNAD